MNIKGIVRWQQQAEANKLAQKIEKQSLSWTTLT
jgi:hypothetical protein